MSLFLDMLGCAEVIWWPFSACNQVCNFGLGAKNGPCLSQSLRKSFKMGLEKSAFYLNGLNFPIVKQFSHCKTI